MYVHLASQISFHLFEGILQIETYSGVLTLPTCYWNDSPTFTREKATKLTRLERNDTRRHREYITTPGHNYLVLGFIIMNLVDIVNSGSERSAQAPIHQGWLLPPETKNIRDTFRNGLRLPRSIRKYPEPGFSKAIKQEGRMVIRSVNVNAYIRPTLIGR